MIEAARPHSRGQYRGLLILVLLLTIIAAACIETPAKAITYENESDQTILIIGIEATGEVVHGEMGPYGGHSLLGSPCIDPDLEARLVDGSVVASRAGPFCSGDPVWVITQAEVDATK